MGTRDFYAKTECEHRALYVHSRMRICMKDHEGLVHSCYKRVLRGDCPVGTVVEPAISEVSLTRDEQIDLVEKWLESLRREITNED